MLTGRDRRDRVDVGLCVRNAAKSLFVPDYAAPMPAQPGGGYGGNGGQQQGGTPGQDRPGGGTGAGVRTAAGSPCSRRVASSAGGGRFCLCPLRRRSLHPHPFPHPPLPLPPFPSAPLCPAGWTYSDALVRLLESHKRKAPWLWAALESDPESRDYELGAVRARFLVFFVFGGGGYG